MIIKIIPLLLILCLVLKLEAQIHYYTPKSKKETLQTDSINIHKGYIKSYFSDFGRIFTAPIRWNKKQWITASLVLGGTALIYTCDGKIQSYSEKNNNKIGRRITKYSLEPLGRGLLSVSALGLFYGIGELTKDTRIKKTALMGMKSFILASVFVQIPKLLINRHRPYHDQPADPTRFEGPRFKFKELYRSMPSGHTISAFSVATIIASEYQSTVWVPIVSYGLAGLAGLSRCYDNKHWASDVFMGAALGYAIGKLVYRSEKWNVKVYPSAGIESANLNVSFQF